MPMAVLQTPLSGLPLTLAHSECMIGLAGGVGDLTPSVPGIRTAREIVLLSPRA
jgi:hypothetical protein